MPDSDVHDFQVRLRRSPEGIIVIEAAGWIDLHNERLLRGALDRAVVYGAPVIVEVNRVRGETIHLLICLVFGLRRVAFGTDGLVVVCTAERLLQLFESAGMEEVFYIVPDLATARELYVDRTVYEYPAPSLRALRKLLRKGFETTPPAAPQVIDRLSRFHSDRPVRAPTSLIRNPPADPAPSTVRKTVLVTATAVGIVATAGAIWHRLSHRRPRRAVPPKRL